MSDINNLIETAEFKNSHLTNGTNAFNAFEVLSNNTYNKEVKLTSEQGKLGIKNLGNSCYMNAALQCLGHTEEIVHYFLNDDFSKDLQRREESEDTNDELLFKFIKNIGDFVHDMWTNSKDTLNPIQLRNSLTRLYPQFDNYYQQDCHEMLTLLLDSLHKQLNRRENKNEMIAEDNDDFSRDLNNCNNQTMSNNSLVRHMSQKFWNLHKDLNDSFIIDNFFGQLKSSIKCLNCLETYPTYDPFSSLGLSIPNEYKILMYFIPINQSFKAIKAFVKINDNMQFKNVHEKMKNMTDFKFTSGIFFTVLNNSMIKIIDMDDHCGDLMNRNAFLFLIESHNSDNDLPVGNTIFIDNFRKFYVCINFCMYEERNSSHSYKSASFPRVFAYDINYLNEGSFIKIPQFLLSYSAYYAQNSNENEVYLTVKSVVKSESDRTVNTCLLCGAIKEEKFVCDCIDKIVKNKFSFKNNLIINYLNNAVQMEDFVLEFNVNFNDKVIKYKDLNKCLDYTQKSVKEKSLDLYDLLDYFTGEEKLCLKDNYICTNCNKNVKAIKRMGINKPPQILIINLKRFKFDISSNRNRLTRRGENGSVSNNYSSVNILGEKNEMLIDFPINNLDLKNYCNHKSSTQYELYAICNHVGKISSGHYTAVCKHPVSNKWIEFDDKLVKPFSEANLVSPNAYILFYKKKENKGFGSSRNSHINHIYN